MSTSLKIISLEEVKKHKSEKDLWMVIHNEVYNITPYINEHPGGEEVLKDVAGTDATANFEDVGHSNDARKIMSKYKIGRLPESEINKSKCSKQILTVSLVVLAAAIIVGVLYKKYA